MLWRIKRESTVSSQALGTTFFNRLDVFIDAIDLKSIVVVCVCVSASPAPDPPRDAQGRQKQMNIF